MSSSNPLVSVIVPSFNHGMYLPQRLKNIANQSYSNLEIILLDDASEDNSKEILQTFSHTESRVKYLCFNEKNSGQPIAQWIKGVEQATGKYVWIAETDDYNDNEFVATMVKVLELNEQVGIAYCASTMVDTAGHHIGLFDLHSPLYTKNIWLNDFIMDGAELAKYYFLVRNIIPNANGAVFNRQLLSGHINKGKQLRYLADWLVYWHMACDTRIAFVNRALNFYRIHDKSTTRSYSIAKHQKIVRERLIIFKAIKAMFGSGYLAFSAALNYMVTNRNKFRGTERLYHKLNQLGLASANIAFYGYNDLAKYLLEREGDNIIPACIFDQQKAGASYNHVPILELTGTALNDIQCVVVLSLRYSQEMRDNLKQLSYTGKVISI